MAKGLLCENVIVKVAWQIYGTASCTKRICFANGFCRLGHTTGRNQKYEGTEAYFTHIEWHMDAYFINVKAMADTPFQWVTIEEAKEKYALPFLLSKKSGQKDLLCWKIWNTNRCICEKF